MGGVKKFDSAFGRLYEKVLSRPGVHDLAEEHNNILKRRALVAALRNQPLEPLPPLLTTEQITALMVVNAVETEDAKSKRQSAIASKPRKGITKKLVLDGARAFAKQQWDAKIHVDHLRTNSKWWKQSISEYTNVQWRTVKRVLPQIGLTEEAIVEYIRTWTPSK